LSDIVVYPQDSTDSKIVQDMFDILTDMHKNGREDEAQELFLSWWKKTQVVGREVAAGIVLGYCRNILGKANNAFKGFLCPSAFLDACFPAKSEDIVETCMTREHLNIAIQKARKRLSGQRLLVFDAVVHEVLSAKKYPTAKSLYRRVMHKIIDRTNGTTSHGVRWTLARVMAEISVIRRKICDLFVLDDIDT